MFVAINTTERVVIPADVAIHAQVPFSFVPATVNREVHIVMVESGRLPGILVMAQGAIRWETCRLMVRIVRSVVVGLVAAEAGVRRVVVVSVVAEYAIVLNGDVRPLKLPVLVVNGEQCRVPVRIGGMA